MTTRFSFLLLIAVFFIVMFASAQNTAFTPTKVAPPEKTGALLQKYGKASTPFPNLGGSWTNDKTNRWRIHLVLHIVKHPELNEQQVRFILDTISSSSSEFDDTPARNTDAALAFQAFRQGALAVFPKEEAAEIFTDIAGGKTDDILKMYHDVLILPLKETKASFRNASVNDKSYLWRTHLALFLVKRPELNESQKKVILTAMSLATPDFFEMRSSDTAWKAKVRDPLRSLEEELVSAFSLKDAAKIFATLHDDTETTNRSTTCADQPLSNSYIQWAHSRFSGQDKEKIKDKELRPCECSTDSDWCSIASYCTGSICKPTQSGCGTLWAYPCNGASCR